MSTRRRAIHGWPFHVAAIGAAVAVLPLVHGVLHVAAGAGQLPTAGGFAFAWALALIAAVLYRRTGAWLAWAAMWAVILGSVTDLPVLHNTVTYLTGASW